MASMVALGLIGLTVLRSDAKRLVLDPLQRMLMIVIRCKCWANELAHLGLFNSHFSATN
jgi:hypothetical protein